MCRGGATGSLKIDGRIGEEEQMARRTAGRRRLRGARRAAMRGMVAVLLGTAAALLVLVACGSPGSSGSSGSSASPGPTGGTHRSDVAVLHRLVACIRAHGIPNFPDGSIDSHGVVSFPQSAPRVPDAAANACRPIFDQLPPQPNPSPPVPQAVFAKLLNFARCMRSHGVTRWPDPAPNGTFFLDRQLINGGKRAVIEPLLRCERLNPGVSGHFSMAASRG
jgi:hypothetical protein